MIPAYQLFVGGMIFERAVLGTLGVGTELREGIAGSADFPFAVEGASAEL